MSDERDVCAALDLITTSFGGKARAELAAQGLRSLVPQSSAESPSLLDLYPWAAEDGVAAFGVGERLTAGKRLSEVTLKIYVEKKMPVSKLRHPVPKQIEFQGLPPIAIDVEAIGHIVPHSFVQRVRPAMPGYSVGREGAPADTGTFGLLVRKKGQTSPFYLLSNSHAIAASGFATKGDVIIQPGEADGGTAARDTIGRLEEWIPFEFSDTGFTNLVDAAIARVDDGAATAAIAQLGVAKGVNTQLTRGMYVQKIGRTTQLSVARVQDVNLRLPVNFPNGTGNVGRVGFTDQVLTSFYTAPGDSGSPVLNMDGEVVGLHMAGSAIVGIFSKIANVMAALDIDVVTRQNLGEAGASASGAALKQ